jgi:hypothetical protein
VPVGWDDVAVAEGQSQWRRWRLQLRRGQSIADDKWRTIKCTAANTSVLELYDAVRKIKKCSTVGRDAGR